MTFKKFRIFFYCLIIAYIPSISISHAKLLFDNSLPKEDFEIEAECRNLFPYIFFDYFNRRECVEKNIEKRDEQIKYEKNLNEERIREYNARGCIAENLSKIQLIIINIKQNLRRKYDEDIRSLNIDQAHQIINAIDKNFKISIIIPEDNFQEKVLVFQIFSNCDSSFHYLANLRFGIDGVARWLRFYSKNRPIGSDDFAMNLSDGENSDEYEAEREKKRKINEEIETKRILEEIKAKKALEEAKQSDEKIRSDREQELQKVAKPGAPGYLLSSNNNCKIWNENPVENETVVFNGDCLNGVASGKGEAIFSSYTNGKLEQQRFEGVFDFGKLNGEGKIISMSGWQYSGEFLNSKKHGYGVLIFANRERYEGFFSNNYPEGNGIFYYQINDYQTNREVVARHGCLWIKFEQTLLRVIGPSDLTESKCKLIYRK